jgi:hypothetical protein
MNLTIGNMYLIQSGDILMHFRDMFGHGKKGNKLTPNQADITSHMHFAA